MQISVIVDINRIPHILKVTPSNPHDSFRNIYLLKQVYVSKLINKQKKCFSIFLFVESKIMEEIIEENHFSKPINLIEDKGYIKSKEYEQYINDTYNINLITPLKINAEDKTISEEDKQLLHDRFVVEKFFSLLKRRFLRISIINDNGVQKNKYL